ncbi:MAG: class I SAM-dependent methyltransferase [Phycisphaeraceae bacterium]|nr:class I SAM-dependent methyltransferase [Phycisphaeraceae bacterium]
MSTHASHDPGRWEQRYRQGDLPWDAGFVSPELQLRLPETGLKQGVAVDIGCGTGTNTVWLAQQGFEVVGMDLSPRAIELASAKVKQERVDDVVRLLVGDILTELPVPAGGAQLVFDRGCFHSVHATQRQRFAEQVAKVLAPGGWWISLSGNADELREADQPGPPQLSALDIVSAVECRFEIVRLSQMRFTNLSQSLSHLAWSCQLRRRVKPI